MQVKIHYWPQLDSLKIAILNNLTINTNKT